MERDNKDTKVEVYLKFLKDQIEEQKNRITDNIQRQMETISNTEDIKDKHLSIKIIVLIKQALDPIDIGESTYIQPPPLDATIIEKHDDMMTKEEAMKLFDFFMIIHFTLWEIRTKLTVMCTAIRDKTPIPLEALAHFAGILKRVKELGMHLEEM
eukprot:TRINITY_DN5006_c0_g1_i1.p1 TRINITY_DN5006_c0_g1~~TRINITY_DN5006_c0_g1_i1.p1  ORF type:complete len:155 (+),score=37.08 TRINITY_DN5006_c0_g1_i1:194-658(+)